MCSVADWDCEKVHFGLLHNVFSCFRKLSDSVVSQNFFGVMQTVRDAFPLAFLIIVDFYECVGGVIHLNGWSLGQKLCLIFTKREEIFSINPLSSGRSHVSYLAFDNFM